MNINETYIGLLDDQWAALLKATDGLTLAELDKRPGPQGNPIGWTVWHSARAEDSIVRGVLQKQPQLWEAAGWFKKFGIEDVKGTGGRQTPEQVGQFKTPSRDLLLAYASTVRDSTKAYVASASQAEMDTEIKSYRGGMVPKSWYLNLLVREVHQHVGQVAYIRGLLRGYEGLF